LNVEEENKLLIAGLQQTGLNVRTRLSASGREGRLRIAEFGLRIGKQMSAFLNPHSAFRIPKVVFQSMSRGLM
ncbi:MAG TPA: hypothetical protein VM095_09385, partial [Pyrinomonadaceae bacterium]|nr:hypothetical protein [Pyrinomonadaceae bacterium]